MSEKESLQDKLDKDHALKFGVTVETIKAVREYEEVHGKFHPEANMNSCNRIALEWYQKQES